ncbi:YihY/virulence factor BrkB family protein [Mumia sp. zg.B53]|uniref:YihY/virulence factor BrkB family protein n=1 Tax=unclassified Mumia TaxID=2621872 RepID=UPI001C6E9EFE|nr:MULTISPECIES: YihY/virulence factor BrkB family protein [unclassified Mumia]MBW9210652.1 YihY/virulence factor BrkB family protein [Mumia sp. zg.B21]MBW9215265.1 YihY/virulence factor BrkB family protein [Mumia sp. zg.B53]
MSVVERIDRFQRSHPFVGFPIAVIYKFFDDSSNYLAAAVTYYAFVAIFPLLLIGSSILGFFLQNDGKLREQLLDTAIGSFPIIADQIESTEGLHGSTTAVVFGALVALYGVLGLGQSSQYAMNVAWAVPRNSRPNPFIGRGVSLVMLGFAGLALLVIAALTGFLSTNPWFDDQHSWAGWLVRGGTLVLSGAAFTVLFLLASARKHSFRSAAPGAFAVAVMWQGLQLAGTAYVQNVIGRSSNLNQIFAVVLGMMGLIYIGAVMAMIGVQINVVRTKRLYPRALLTPFTDNVNLTKADQRAYSDYAKAQRHKGFESIRVMFGRPEEWPRVELPPPVKRADRPAVRE